MTAEVGAVRFGQLFVGEAGKVIVLEPKDIQGKNVVLHQPHPSMPVSPIGYSPEVERWTHIVENYGPMFSKGSAGFHALASLFKQNMWQAGVLNMIPEPDRQIAWNTLKYGKAQPFNGGLRLDYPA